MRFTDFLKATVMTCAAAATAMAVVTMLVGADDSIVLLSITVGWWVIATAIGGWMGRRATGSKQIRTLLAEAESTTTLPELRSGTILLNRLWPLLVVTVGSIALAPLSAQVSGMATGFAIIWALGWRNQSSAVLAIEQRDGAQFFVRHTSPFKAIKLLRAPGMRLVDPPTRTEPSV